ncbi:MAG: rRNA maturation RNase YbeY [Bacillota bacterium]|nr:rRNA maturation RNase YbeY [Bacillota bacterium]
MRILYSEENILNNEMPADLEKAAQLCVEKEGLNPDNAEISLTFVSKEEIRELNNQYRGIDNHTDVLSFPLIEDFDSIEDDEEYMLGDVVICLDVAREQAVEFGHSEKREIVYLFVHSVCHLLGFDHMEEDEKQEMRQREEEVMTLLDIQRRD